MSQQEMIEIPKEKLTALVEKHAGHRRNIAKALGVSRFVLIRELKRHKLVAAADGASATIAKKGPRPEMSGAAKAAERDNLLTALAATADYQGAADALGVSRATLCRRIAPGRHNITRDEIERARARLSG